MNTVQDKEVLGLKTFIVYYLTYWRWFLAAFVFSSVLALCYLFFYPRTYEIKTSILIQEDKSLGSAGFNLGEAAGIMKSFGLGGNMVGSINMENEVGILSSKDLLSKVVSNLGLNISYTEPFSFGYKNYSNMPIKVLPDSIMLNSLENEIYFSVDIDNAGNVTVEVEAEDGVLKYNSKGLPFEIPFPSCSFVIEKTDFYKLGESYSYNVIISPVSWIADDIIDMISIEPITTTSSVVDILYQDYEKVRGIDLLTNLVDEYNKRAQSLKDIENGKSISFLDIRINSLVSELLKKEQELETYKLKNKITSVEYDIQYYAENMKELQVKIIEFEAQKNVVELLIDYIKDPKNKYNLVPSMLSGKDSESNPVSVYNEALLERARIIQSSKDNNPLVDSWNDKVDKLRESVYLSIENTKKGLDITISDLKNKEMLILEKMGNVPTYEREYIDIKRQCEILQGMYLILLQKREEITLSNEQSRYRAEIVNAPYVKQHSIAPRKLYAGLAVIFLTLFIPVILLFAKEQYFSIKAEYKRLNN